MKILYSDLENAAQKGLITNEQVSALWSHFEDLRPEQSRFHGLHVIYYFGGILILASMAWFLTKAWDDGLLVMTISALFAFLYALTGDRLMKKENLTIPGGLLITAAVGLTPVLIYGFQKFIGIWPEDFQNTEYMDFHRWVRSGWVPMEIGTIIAALIALRFYRFAFLIFPLAFSLWYISMDLTPVIFQTPTTDWEARKIVSLLFGIPVLLIAFWVDKKWTEIDYAFWLYLSGSLAFWAGLSTMGSDSEVGKLIYCLINVGFIALAVYLRRSVFIVLGTIGVLGYLGHLAHRVFKDSFTFPIALAFLGILILYIGVQYQKNKSAIERAFEKALPIVLTKWRPKERA